LRIGVTPLEMADAYATIANGGTHIDPTIIDHVVFPDGSVVNVGNPPRRRVFTDSETAAAIQILKGVITSGTGTAAGYGCPAAGKTGTSNNLANAWFVGFTPKLSTAVWVGYPQGNIGMPNGFGGALAAPIWHDYMTQASNGYCGDFPPQTTTFQGTAFFGPHSVTGNANVGTGTGTSTTGTSTATTGTSTNSYNNPTVYTHPPQPGNGNSGNGTTGTQQPLGNGHSTGGAGTGGAGTGTGTTKHN
jgi:penicillin-binding protein 1A